MNCANHPDRERVAFCQNCGKPLCPECTRVVGSAVFCEPCLAARLAGAGSPPYASTSDHINSVVDGVVRPPHAPGAPSPGLATLLGFIPGVGAMYNGQYAKGIVHLVVFAILVSLANDVNGIFGLFIAGWVIYQAIDANHTARARLAGTPLPNPFGLNDLGERLGFGRAWPSAAPYTPGAAPYASTNPGQSNPATSTSPPPQYPPYTPPTAGWGAPPETYSTYGVPPMSPNPTYGTPYPTGDPNAPNPNFVPRHRFPAGAMWLIGLGTFFLLANTGLFHGFPIHHFTPFLLIGAGVWLFMRSMTNSGPSLTDDGTPMYRFRLLRALRGSLWVTLVGVLFLLHDFHIMSWSRSWPLFIIASGVMIFIQRFAYDRAAYHTYAYPPPAGPAAPAASPSTSIVPTTHTDSPDRQPNDLDRN